MSIFSSIKMYICHYYANNDNIDDVNKLHIFEKSLRGAVALWLVCWTLYRKVVCLNLKLGCVIEQDTLTSYGRQKPSKVPFLNETDEVEMN